jgi:cytochrome P450
MTKLPGIPRWQSAVSSFKMAKNPLPFLNKFIREKGPTVQVYLGGLYKMILTTDPDFIQHILQKNNKNYRKSEVHFDKIQHFLGRGLLTSEGPYWLQQRRLIQPGFHKKRLEDLLGLMDKVAIEVLDELDEAIQIQPQVDMYEKMLEITFRIIANSIFGQDLGQEQLARLSDSITQLQEFIVRQIRQPYYNTWFKLSGKVKEHEVLRDEADAIIHHYIEERRKSKEQHSDLLQMLMEARYEDTGEGMTDQQLIDEVKILFVAGHDTSSNALAWTWYLLGLHPEALEKVRKEVDQIIGEEQPSFEKIMQLEYTQQVIEESMRLYPPAWTTNRVAAGDDEFKGIKIKKGTTFATYIYGVHHSPELWEDPEAFRPERFSKEEKKKHHPYAFIPFGGGPRLCIGNNFALMEMKLILARMVNRYEFNLAPGQEVRPLPLITLRPENGIRIEVRKRDFMAADKH